MGRGKIAALLLVMLILSVTGSACFSQGTQEQNRPAESQNSAEEDTKEENKDIAKEMEETGKEEEKEEGKEAEK
jgi:cytochrome c556